MGAYTGSNGTDNHGACSLSHSQMLCKCLTWMACLLVYVTLCMAVSTGQVSSESLVSGIGVCVAQLLTVHMWLYIYCTCKLYCVTLPHSPILRC